MLLVRADSLAWYSFMNNYDNIAYSIKQLGRKNILIGDQTMTDIPQNTYYIAVKEM